MKKINYILLAFFSFVLAGIICAEPFEITQKIPFNNVMDVYPADFEQDGDTDILAVSSDNIVALFRNDGSENFEEILIDGNFDGVRTIRGEDIDGDGDLDIAAAAWRTGDINWYRNDGGLTFTKIVIDDNFPGAHTVQLYDYDKDGDIDLLCSGFDFYNKMGEVAWFENDGNQLFTKHLVSERFEMSTFIDTVDFNSDGNLDIIACCESLGEIYWWRNEGNGNYTEIPFSTTYQRPHTILPRDFDGDGDSDIFGSSFYGGVLAIWENLGNETFNQTNIDTIAGSLWFDMSDFDMDGDSDLFATGTQGAFWYKNENGNFAKNKLPGGFVDGYCMRAVDIDGDKDIDLIGAGRAFNHIAIWYNDLYTVDFSTGLKTGHAPFEVQFENNSIQGGVINQYVWDFNNDGIAESGEENPVFTYEEPGVYSVNLVVETEYYTGSMFKDNYIYVFNGESALLFENDNSYAAIADMPDLTNDFTLELFVKPASYGELNPGSYLLDKQSIKVSVLSGGLGVPKNSFRINLLNSAGEEFTYFSEANAFEKDIWQQIAVCYLDGNVKLYVNGVSMPLTVKGGVEISGALLSNQNEKLYIGNEKEGERSFPGMIDELRIWTIFKTATEISEYANSYPPADAPDLSVYFKMDEANGEIITDSKSSTEGMISGAVFRQGVDFDDIVLSLEEIPATAPQIFSLEQNYPNPFNGITNIKFSLSDEATVSLDIYNLLGERVATVVNKELLAEGTYSYRYNSKGLSSGVYLYELKANGTEQSFVNTRTMVLMK